MKTFGPLYTGTLKYWHKNLLPIVEIGKTQETEMPYRRGRCLVFRAPFTHKAVYVGILFKSVSNPEYLTDEDIDLIVAKAMRGRTAWTPEEGLFDETFETQED